MMSTSAPEGKDITVEWVKGFGDINRVLDIGTGEGTYFVLLGRPDKVLNHAHWTGIEVWQPNIERFGLRNLYHQLIEDDARTVDYDNLGPFDLVIAGDVLEHMTKEEAITLVDNVMRNSKRLIISIPIVHYPQDEAGGNPYQRHVKDDWSDEEMTATFNISRKWVGKEFGVYLIENS